MLNPYEYGHLGDGNSELNDEICRGSPPVVAQLSMRRPFSQKLGMILRITREKLI